MTNKESLLNGHQLDKDYYESQIFYGKITKSLKLLGKAIRKTDEILREIGWG